MATSGGLSSLFDKPKLPENPTLMESLSAWNQIMPKKAHDSSSFTEIFGELHFHEKCADPLQLCTEGLGSESCGTDVDELQVIDDGSISSQQEVLAEDYDQYHCTVRPRRDRSKSFSDVRSRLSGGGGFPPPIPSIGSGGKPWISFESYRQGGRFVLREVRVPTEFLHASREDGRLKLQLVQRDEDVSEDEEDNDGEEEVGSDEEESEQEGEEMDAVVNQGDGH